MVTRWLPAALVLAACGSSPSSAVDAPPGTTVITGTLGSLGDAQPTVSSLMIANSGETLVYLSSGPITCDTLTVSRWLGGTQAGTQVVELVWEGDAAVMDLDVPPGEVNFAPGGMSSSHEVGAVSGSIHISAAEIDTSISGSFTAAYPGGSHIQGQFSATFCPGGQDY